MECYLCTWLYEFEFALIKPCEERIRCYITHEQDGADDGQTQLAHTFAEKHDAHCAQEDDHDEQDAEAIWTCTFETLECSVSMERKVRECGYYVSFDEILTDIGDESHEGEDDNQCEVNCL